LLSRGQLLLVEAENARRAKMTSEKRGAEEDRLEEESEAEFEAVLRNGMRRRKAGRVYMAPC